MVARAARVILRVCVIVLAVLLAKTSSNANEGLGGVVVTVLSQGDAYHSTIAREKRQQWLKQAVNQGSLSLVLLILLAHELPVKGASWTVVPFLPYLAKHYTETEWFIFVNEETNVDFVALGSVLKHYNKNKAWFLGHALKDQTSTIIHHYLDYASNETISYPNFASGWVLSRPALKRAAENAENFAPSFNIDAQFELAVFLKYMRSPGLQELHPALPAMESGGILLTHTPELCMQRQLSSPCATAYSHDVPSCGKIERSKIFFGVKTCEKFHSTRLTVVQGTWALDAEGSIAYYSEVEDEEYQTTDIGVPNTESGHCGKMMAIINRFHSSEELQKREWLIITDDDTLLSVPRLCRLLACYQSDQPILLGKAYGYNAEQPGGYTYITGGGSMVLSRAAVKKIVGSGLYCPQDNTPDDMYLGGIAGHLGINIIHSPLFHQAQPSSFHPDILRLQTPVSFHRHKPADPYTVYAEYLTDNDGQSKDKQTGAKNKDKQTTALPKKSRDKLTTASTKKTEL